MPVEVSVDNPRGRNLGRESSNKDYREDEKSKRTFQEPQEELTVGLTAQGWPAAVPQAQSPKELYLEQRPHEVWLPGAGWVVAG